MDAEERRARNEAAFRAANERIAETARETLGIDELVPFLCECDDTGCFTLVQLDLDEYVKVRSNPRWFLELSEHTDGEVSAVVEEHGRWQIVEKLGRGGQVAEETAP
jgi:hypothetical protein